MKKTCRACSEDLRFLQGKEVPNYGSGYGDTLAIVSLFSGCGGLTLGVAEAARRLGLGVHVRLAVDLEHAALAVFKRVFPEANAVCARVEQFFGQTASSDQLLGDPHLLGALGPVDLLLGGPPCQGHSDLNNHTRRNDTRNLLYSQMAVAAKTLIPRAIIIENVPAVRHDEEKVLDKTIECLKGLGYVVAAAVLNLDKVGVPQTRRRHFALAAKEGLFDPELLFKRLNHPCPKEHLRTVKWAIGDLEELKSNLDFDKTGTPSSTNVGRINWLFDNGKDDLPNRLRPDCHHGDHSYKSMYGRLGWDKPAQTITTGFGSMGQGRFVHPSKRRTITAHEAARLQTFPDFVPFEIVDRRGVLAKLIGNAVPPLLGVQLGRLVISELLQPTQEVLSAPRVLGSPP